jgi:hypothetical protein
MAGLIPVIFYLRSAPPGVVPRVLLISLVAGVCIAIPMLIHKRRRLRTILQRSSGTVPAWPTVERRGRNIGLWRQLSPVVHGLEFLYIGVLASLCAWIAMMAVGDRSLLMGIGSLPLAALASYMILTLLRYAALAAARTSAPAS